MKNKRFGIFTKFKLQAISDTSTNNSLISESIKCSSCPPSEGVNDVEKVPKRPFQGSETKRSASPYLHKVESEHN